MHQPIHSKDGDPPAGIHPLIQPFPPAQEDAAASNVYESPTGIHPLIQPFPPAKEDAINASQTSTHTSFSMGKPQARYLHSRSKSAVSNTSFTSKKSVKLGLGSKEGMMSVANMPPCSECGRTDHQRTHCFFAHPSNLRKFLEAHPWKTDFWEKRLAAHKAVKKEKKKQEDG